MSKQPSNQISTLEVLGEDSDARRKRFESSLADNRYIQLKPLREAQRLRDVAAGLIPDPLKPRRLDEATDFVGTCAEMCPEFEREEREYQNNVDHLERYPGTTRIDPARAVKAFHRPAAGNEQPLPSDVRPPAILKSTLDYLFRKLMPTKPLAETHPFLRDRTRAVRQDFTMQNERGTVAVECNERIARYHVLALGVLREQSAFSESQELEQLRKVLKSLNEFYDDARLASPPVPTPNEAEFRAYNILTHLRDPDIIWSTELLPPAVFHHPLLQLALDLHALAQRSSLPRGERASPNAFARFFKLVASEEVPYLFGCLLSSHFPEIRRYALEALRNAYVKQHAALPAQTLVKMLGADDEDEISAICEAFGIATSTNEEGTMVVELNKAMQLKPGSLGALKGHVSQRIVEAKRGKNSYADVIDGLVRSALPVPPMAATPPPQKPRAQPAFPTTSAFGAPHLRPQGAETPIPSLPPSRTATPVAQQPKAAPALGKLNPVASAFVPPKQSPFGLSSTPSTVEARAPSPFGLGAAAAHAFQPKAASPFGAPPSAAPQAAKATPFELPPSAQAQPSPFGFGAQPAQPPQAQPTPPAFAAAKPVPAAAAQPSTFSFSPTPLNAPPIGPTLAPKTSPTVASLPPPVTPVRPGPSPLSTTPFAPPPAKARDPALVARVNAVVRALTEGMLKDAVKPVVRRAVEAGLAHRWQLETAERKRLVGEHASALASWLIADASRAHTIQSSFEAMEDKRLKTGALRVWRETLYEKLTQREEENERRRQFQLVAREIGIGADFTDVEMIPDDVSSVISLKRLNLGPKASHDKRKLDQAVSQRVDEARNKRAQLWTRGTFLEMLVERVEPLLRELQLGARPSWATLVWTARKESAFASWLGCKFALDEESASVQVESREVKFGIKMVEGVEEVEENVVGQTGLIVFDATRPKDSPAADFWSTARDRLSAIVLEADDRSLFKPVLLVILCAEAGSNAASTQATATRELGLAALASEISKSAVWVVDLPSAEEQLESQLSRVLARIQPRRERVRRPLDEFIKPLVAAWRSSLREALALTNRHGASASELTRPYVEALNLAVRETKAAAISAPAELVEISTPPNTAATLRADLTQYIQLPFFKGRNASLLISALGESNPPASELTLVRLLLDQLAEWTLDAAQGGETRQAELDSKLASALKRLRERLSAIEAVRPVLAAVSVAKKRKASLGGEVLEEPRHKQKMSVNEPSPRKEDRLSALSALMRDARSLLTDQRAIVSS